MNNSVTRAGEVWHRLKPYALKDMASMISSSKSGSGSTEGYMILLYAKTSEKVRMYSATEAGLNAALAAAVSGDAVFLPACTIGGNQSVPDGVSLVGIDRKRCVLTGRVTLGSNSALGEASVIRSGASDSLSGVVLDNGGARIFNCIVSVTNPSGDAVGVLANEGVVGYADDCIVTATGSGDGYAYYANKSEIHVQGGSADGSTQPAGAE